MGNDNTDNLVDFPSAAGPSGNFGGDGGGGDYPGIGRRIEKLEDKVIEIDKRVVKIEEQLNHMPTKWWMAKALITAVVAGGGALIFIARLLSSITTISFG